MVKKKEKVPNNTHLITDNDFLSLTTNYFEQQIADNYYKV